MFVFVKFLGWIVPSYKKPKVLGGGQLQKLYIYINK